MGRLAGRVAIVTGAGHDDGIGHGIATILLREGASVVTTDIDVESGELSASRLAAQYGSDRIMFLRQDVTDAGDWDDVLESATTRFGGLDILVNNAGSLIFGALQELDLEQFRQVMSVNLESQFIGIQKAIPSLAARAGLWPSGASIINIISLASHLVDPGNMAYHISKAGARKLTQCAAKELAPQKIRVNSIHPGMVQSRLVNRHLDHMVSMGQFADRAAAIQQMIAIKPLGCLAEAEDIGTAAAFLASDDAKYIVGISLDVDGGMMLRY